MDEQDDTAEVRIFPPAIPLLTILIGTIVSQMDLDAQFGAA